MELRDAIPRVCPNCGHADRLSRAVEARQDAVELVDRPLDVALPWYALCSIFLAVAAAALFLSAMATEGSGFATFGSVVLEAIAGASGLIGAYATRRNVVRMRALEPAVRAVHERAIYCGTCECVYFNAAPVPRGMHPYVAMSLPDYRRELWHACGLVRMP
jgi:ribosomal protein S27AE